MKICFVQKNEQKLALPLQQQQWQQGSISPTFWPKDQMCWQSFFGTIQLHQQNFAQLKEYKQLKVTPNFYSVCSGLYASKFSQN